MTTRRIVTAKPRGRLPRRVPTSSRARLTLQSTEKKFYDTVLNGGVLTTTTDASGGERNPASDALTTILQGDGQSNRDGRKVVVVECEVRGHITEASTENGPPAPPQAYFIALVQDRQTNGVEVVSENVFTQGAADVEFGIMPKPNLAFEKRFRIIKQLFLRRGDNTMNGTTSTIAVIDLNGAYVPFHFKVKLNMPVLYSNTTEVIASTVDNSLSIIAWAMETTVATPLISYHARIRFVG